MSSESPTAFIDIPVTEFPFTVEGYDSDTGDTVWTQEVSGPGSMKIPGKPEDVREIQVRVTFPDGSVWDTKQERE